MTDTELLSLEPYGLARAQKRALLTRELAELTKQHAAGCPEYAAMLTAYGADPDRVQAVSYTHLRATSAALSA